MTRIVFDASVHLGQFLLGSEDLRRGCKNSQASLSGKPAKDTVGIITFNENSWVDHIIWNLDRQTQDIFYRFMDRFHSLKTVERIPLFPEDAELALKLSAQLEVDFPSALSCAVAIAKNTNELHSLYPSLQNKTVISFLKEEHGILIKQPSSDSEQLYPEPELEKTYQDALLNFREHSICFITELGSVSNLYPQP